MPFTLEVKNSDNESKRYEFNKWPDECPMCHHHCEPKYMGVAHVMRSIGNRVELALRCPRHECQRLFIARYTEPDTTTTLQLRATTPISERKIEHPETIKELSPQFVKIYSESTFAEDLELEQIAGMGYRKALEFLVKDFLIKQRPADAEAIKKTFLGTVINNYIDDPQVKLAAERATWLGNDEAHYVKKWTDKDVTDLKELIRLSRNAIENVLLAAKYKKDMPEKK